MTPSKEDIATTIRLKECGQILGIELLDHIIIGDQKFTSLVEEGISYKRLKIIYSLIVKILV